MGRKKKTLSDKLYRKHLKADASRWKEYERSKKYIERREEDLVYAPVISFLRPDERDWIGFVNGQIPWAIQNDAVNNFSAALLTSIQGTGQRMGQAEIAALRGVYDP